MKNKRKAFTIIGLLSFVALLAISGLSTAFFNTVKAAYEIASGPSFQSTQLDGRIFFCYKIGGTGNEKKIAVSWGKKPSEAPSGTDSNLAIPETLKNDITSDTTTYTVVAIAKGGFARCVSEYFTLPDTIEEIREGAFAYCEKLKEITIPPLVNKISASTFVDCRKLKTISYRENTAGEGEDPVYETTSSNSTITRIENHAFDSCVSMLQFECPKSLVYIGVSAFQNCDGLTRFYLPSKSASYGNLSIDKYAFADCNNLYWVYFEENLTSVANYAFVDCKTSLIFHFGYDSSGGDKPNPEFGGNTLWRRKSLKEDNTTYYEYDDTTHILLYSADGYPGLKIGIDNKDIYLNSFLGTASDGATTNTIKIVDGSAGKYAIIYQWDNPGKDVKIIGSETEYYYRYGSGGDGSGILTIPSTVVKDKVTYPIKVIGEGAFLDRTELKEVHFRNNIVQIQKRAFYRCSNIDTFKFDWVDSSSVAHCVTTLREISKEIFNSKDVYNDMPVTELKLPASLEYIGPFAFANFSSVTQLKFTTPVDDTASRKSSLKAIGRYAFANLAEDITVETNYPRITLPCSLDDREAYKASMDESYNWAAIGPYSFSAKNNQNHILTVEMEECETASNHYTSLAPYAFYCSQKMQKFVSNKRLCLIGSGAFEKCEKIKEIFLRTESVTTWCANNTGKTYVWGTTNQGVSANNSIVSNKGTQTYPNLVIYVSGNSAPGSLETATNTSKTDTNVRWNSENASANAFPNNLSYHSNQLNQSRSIIPTYYGVDYSNVGTTDVIYYEVGTSSTKPKNWRPVYSTDYFQQSNKGIIAFVKQGSYYTVARYYLDKNNDGEIDLRGISHTYDETTINISSKLTEIGPSAFASNQRNASTDNIAAVHGRFFVLPKTVTAIGERAFYRYDSENNSSVVSKNGVAIVTTENDAQNAILGATSITLDLGEEVTSNAYDDIKSAFSNSSLSYGYCRIPKVTTIGNDAFFNNVFKEVDLATSISKMGRSAFYNRYNSQLDTMTGGDNSTFTITNHGLYYTGNANKKTLLYQFQNDTSALSEGVNELTIESGTKAIGSAAVTKTKYTKINLNSGLKQIYGSSFQGNDLLTEVAGGSDLEYISAMPYKVTAYKIERYKHFGHTNIGNDTTDGKARPDIDDLTPWGTLSSPTSTDANPMTVDFVDEESSLGRTMYLFTTNTGKNIYAQSNTVNKNGTGQSNMYEIPFPTDDEDIIKKSDNLPFDLIDYHSTISSLFDDIENRNCAFKDCVKLEKVDFRSMTNLKKIGSGAFKGCEKLTDYTLDNTYTYYSYNANTNTVTSTESKTKNVLDLSNCTSLLSIGAGAFSGCTSIQYAHLPYTSGRLYIQTDPQVITKDTQSNVKNNEKIFDGNSSMKILVGDREIRSNSMQHTNFGGLDIHYPPNWYGSNSRYYFIPYEYSTAEELAALGGPKDIFGGNDSIKYWTKNPTKLGAFGFILFETGSQASDYFNALKNGETINWP